VDWEAATSTARKVAWPGGKAEGEGFEPFEPSIRLTTDNGFRDRYEYCDLQGLFRSCASVCASQQPSVHGAGRPEHFTRNEGVPGSSPGFGFSPLCRVFFCAGNSAGRFLGTKRVRPLTRFQLVKGSPWEGESVRFTGTLRLGT
jgi:hypothetical protein